MSNGLEIAPYNLCWVEEFEAERARIACALGALAKRIDHHGSTSVPGLAAKPIIDIQVSVERLEPLRAFAEPLAGMGYLHMPHKDDAVCPFFHRSAEWPHTHHVHVVKWGGIEERRTLAFRDYLREHPEAAQEYAALKMRLAAQADAEDATSREAYAAAKSDFVESLVRIAFAAGLPRELRGARMKS